ncbi:MAG: sugar ABC transporter permease [Lachnospiraceae bacterium]|nr:sugar ABC transporter permease [Lachnospiraceae bacterium]
MARRKSANLWGWLFVLPTIIGLIVLNIYPMIRTIWQSFHRVGDFGLGNEFVGMDNYERLFAGGIFGAEIWQAAANTIFYTLLEVPLSIVIALILAVFLNGKIRGRTTFRVIFFLPMIVAPAAVAMVWRWLFNTEFGLINNVFGIRVSWLSNPNIALFSLAIIGIWSVIGYNMILFLASLQDVPRDYYEAASIDGASPIRQFFSITLPLISPMIFFVTVTRVIAGLQIFDSIFMIMGMGTGGNPALPRTQSLVYIFYRYAFINRNWGMGATVVVFLLVLIALVTAVQMIAQKKWVHYN